MFTFFIQCTELPFVYVQYKKSLFFKNIFQNDFTPKNTNGFPLRVHLLPLAFPNTLKRLWVMLCSLNCLNPARCWSKAMNVVLWKVLKQPVKFIVPSAVKLLRRIPKLKIHPVWLTAILIQKVFIEANMNNNTVKLHFVGHREYLVCYYTQSI